MISFIQTPHIHVWVVCPMAVGTALFDSRIIGLTGDPSRTEAIAKTFHVYAKKAPSEKADDYLVDHNGIVYLMDKRGKFVSIFNLERPPSQAAREFEGYL